MNGDLDRSYAHCRQVVRRSSSNLAWCFWLLPWDQRRGMDALYAFARQADDLVDREGPVEWRREKHDEFRSDLAAALAGDVRPPLFPAVADTVQRFGIDPRLLHHLLDGVALDLSPQTPATYAELYAYCYRVASVIGLACLPIWGCTDPRAAPPAIDCGIAFQLTNILRDLREDAERGRCYWPADEIERFGIDVGWQQAVGWDQLAQQAPAHLDCSVASGGPAPASGRLVPPYVWTEPLAELIEFQIARAKSYYESAEETACYLPPPGRRVFALMVARYRSILAAIERDPSRIVRERVSLSWPRKVAVAVGAMWGSGFRVQGSGGRGQKSDGRTQSAIRNPQSAIETPHSALRIPHLPSVAILGGGLAGLAAAVALCQRGLRVELFEARQKLGGRAGSYVDKDCDQLVDHCQHVAMGCCTNFLDFCRQTKLLGLLTRHRRLHFFGPDGSRCDFQATPLLPAPLHLVPALLAQKYLSPADRRAIATAMLRLARLSPADGEADPTIGQWLRDQRQSASAIEHFWQVVLVSALGESLDRASLAAARKVFVDGFIAARGAYEVLTPDVPLGELYDERLAVWLRMRGVTIHFGSPVTQIIERNSFRYQSSQERNGFRSTLGVTFKDGAQREFDFVIAAVPWRRLPEVLSAELAAKMPDAVTAARTIEPSPITGIHLWFDRPITDLPHAVLVGRLVQWMFAKFGARNAECGVGHRADIPHSPLRIPQWYYQVVVSASRNLAGRERDGVLREVLGDLNAVFPPSREAKLVRWQMVTDQEAVFSVRPGLSRVRPPQRTAVPNLFLAGDWTATGWPATMEGAVRSGYLAAEALLECLSRRQTIVAPDLPRGWLARWLVGGNESRS
jgi:squalene-associated FAD-dependent desaturase